MAEEVETDSGRRELMHLHQADGRGGGGYVAGNVGTGDEFEAFARELMREVGRELSRRRVPWPGREEVGQDVLLWFLRHWASFSGSHRLLPVVRTVVGRFLRRRNGWRYEIQRLEPAGAVKTHRAAGLWHEGGGRLAFLEMLTALPARERRLAALLARGATWVEACGCLGVRPGSRSYFRERLRADLRRLVA
jgi:hypothetical protein